MTTDPRMRDAWTELDQAPLIPLFDKTESQRRQEFLHAYLMIAVWSGMPASYWDTVPTAAEQRKRLQKISTLARELQELLGPHIQPEADRTRHTSWQTLNAGLEAGDLPTKLRAKLTRLQSESTRVGGDPVLPPFISLIAAFATLPGMLDTMAELAAFASQQELPKPPKRVRGKPAGAMDFLSNRLGSLIRQYLARPCHGAVACTVTVALDLTTPLDPDEVRKRLPPRHQTPKSQATGGKSKKSI